MIQVPEYRLGRKTTTAQTAWQVWATGASSRRCVSQGTEVQLPQAMFEDIPRFGEKIADGLGA
jgi:hypothetical protein